MVAFAMILGVGADYKTWSHLHRTSWSFYSDYCSTHR